MLYLVILLIAAPVVTMCVLKIRSGSADRAIYGVIAAGLVIGAGLFIVDFPVYLQGGVVTYADIWTVERTKYEKDNIFGKVIEDSQGNRYFLPGGLRVDHIGGLKNVKTRIASLPTTGYILKIDAGDFGDSWIVPRSRGGSVIYDHTDSLWFILIATLLAEAAAAYLMRRNYLRRLAKDSKTGSHTEHAFGALGSAEDTVQPYRVMDAMPQVVCPACRRKHDLDYPKCPFCGHDYIKHR